jgi:hypothetical protein
MKESYGNQAWYCERCCKSGTVYYTDNERDVWSVFRKIKDAHKEISSSCEQPIEQIRCVNPDFVRQG